MWQNSNMDKSVTLLGEPQNYKWVHTDMAFYTQNLLKSTRISWNMKISQNWSHDGTSNQPYTLPLHKDYQDNEWLWWLKQTRAYNGLGTIKTQTLLLPKNLNNTNQGTCFGSIQYGWIHFVHCHKSLHNFPLEYHIMITQTVITFFK